MLTDGAAVYDVPLHTPDLRRLLLPVVGDCAGLVSRPRQRLASAHRHAVQAAASEGTTQQGEFV